MSLKSAAENRKICKDLNKTTNLLNILSPLFIEFLYKNFFETRQVSQNRGSASATKFDFDCGFEDCVANTFCFVLVEELEGKEIE